MSDSKSNALTNLLLGVFVSGELYLAVAFHNLSSRVVDLSARMSATEVSLEHEWQFLREVFQPLIQRGLGDVSQDSAGNVGIEPPMPSGGPE